MDRFEIITSQPEQIPEHGFFAYQDLDGKIVFIIRERKQCTDIELSIRQAKLLVEWLKNKLND